MWFNDMDIHLRCPSNPPGSGGVAPGRHQLARAGYLERRAQWERERRRYELAAGFAPMRAWGAALTAGCLRRIAAAVALTGRSSTLPSREFQ
jgi:hypothetical protein